MTQDTDALRLWTQLTLVRDVRLARERHAVSEARMVVEHAALGVQSARAALARHFVAEGAIVEACRREAPASEGWLATLRAHRGRRRRCVMPSKKPRVRSTKRMGMRRRRCIAGSAPASCTRTAANARTSSGAGFWMTTDIAFTAIACRRMPKCLTRHFGIVPLHGKGFWRSAPEALARSTGYFRPITFYTPSRSKSTWVGARPVLPSTQPLPSFCWTSV